MGAVGWSRAIVDFVCRRVPAPCNCSEQICAMMHPICGRQNDRRPSVSFGPTMLTTPLKRTGNALRLSEARLGLIVDHVPALIAYFDAHWRCTYCNKPYAAWFGLRVANIKGRHMRDITGIDTFERIQGQCARAFAGEQVTYERPHTLRNGSVGYLEATLSPHFDTAGKVLGIYVLAADTTERVLAREALALSRERLDFALRGSNLCWWDANVVTGEVRFSKEWTGMLGFPAEESGSSLEALLAITHPDDVARAVAVLRDALKGVIADGRAEIRMKTRSGQWKWIEFRGKAVDRDSNGWALRLTGTNADISARKLAEEYLRTSQAQMRLVLDNVPVMLFYLDEERRCRLANEKSARFFGWDLDSMIGMHIEDITGSQAYQQYRRHLDVVFSGMPVAYERDVERPDGTSAYIEVTLVPHVGDDGRVVGCYSLARDITREIEAESRMNRMKQRDALTDLMNRPEFETRLRVLLMPAETGGNVLLYLNIDELKVVNDRCGHAAGDECLRQIAALLRANTFRGQTLARLGSDEFGILLENVTLASARNTAEKLREAMQALHFAWQDRWLPLTVSIGVVALAGQSVNDAFAQGDAACRTAKNRGRNRIHVYHAGDREIALRHSQLEWRERIMRSLHHDQFRLYRQSIAPLHPSAETINHCEVLLRMLDENGQAIAPMAFLPTAEHFGLMPLIDRWVVSATLDENAKFKHRRNAALDTVTAINLSGATLGDEDFPGFLHEQFARHLANPRSICFEITETVAISNFGNAIRFINEFKNLGCRFSLDDFGSGMSSFGYLRSLPVDYLKIDGSFIRAIHRDPIDLAMVASINHIGHLMGTKTIAEFVENEETMVLLRKIGVDYAQGFWIDTPRPTDMRLHG